MSALDRPTLFLLGLLSALRALGLVVVADSLATGIVSVIQGDSTAWHSCLAWGLAAAVARALTSWGRRVVAARALLGTKERLRAELAERLVAGGGAGDATIGASSTLATRGLDELDKYLTVFLPALVDAAVVPLLVGARILVADWLSAAIIVVTVPLIPVFMALIGLHTRERVGRATDALGRLSEHLVELARGLPVLVGLGRAQEQALALRTISEQYRARTVATLRTAFLSSLALELIATLSVAVVAVTIGVRLVTGDLPLEIGLLALLLAPECYAPLREIGTAFHAAEDGREALGRVRRVLDEPMPDRPHLHGGAEWHDDGAIRVCGLTVRYQGRDEPAVDHLHFTAPGGEITVLDGASGAGKSTIFAVLTGSLAGTATVCGTVGGVHHDELAWLPQHPHVLGDTALQELLVYSVDLADAAGRAQRALAALGLAHLAHVDPARLSPGELRRLAFARVLLRIEAGARVVLLDEPTAHLDDASAAVIIAAIARLRRRVTVLVASHDPAVRELADGTVRIGAAAPHGQGHGRIRLAEGVDRAGQSAGRRGEDDGRVEENAGRAEGSAPTAPGEARHALRELAVFLRPIAGRLAGAAALGSLATLFALALTALSGWLIVRASEHPPIMYLLVAIVGVRFFGIGRAVLRYAERLVSHDAIFAALTGLRMRLWRGLSRRGAGNRALLTGANALDHLVGNVDQVRDLSIRVVLPPVVAVLSTAVVIAALGVLDTAVVPLLCALGVLTFVLAPAAALGCDRAAARGQQLLRSRVLRRFAALLGAADELRANGVDARVREELRELDARAGAAARHSAWALGVGGALIVGACCAAAVLMLPLTAPAVARGELAPELVAVLALTPLGLIDPLLDATAAVQQWPALREVLGRVSTLTTPAGGAAGAADGPGVADDEGAAASAGSPGAAAVSPTVARIRLHDVAAAWPGMTEPVFEHVDADVRRGDWLVVTGPSGAGKTTLLMMLLGHLRPLAGRYEVNGIDSESLPPGLLRRSLAWCPQEGHLFNSSLRGNLLIARGRADAPDDAEMRSVLRLVGLGPLLESLPAGLDTPIGPSGSHLSGGERQRIAVARTLLTRADVILIDEPTAHLDEQSAQLLMADLRAALREKIAVLITHQAVGVLPGDVRVRLGAQVRAPQPTVGAAA